MIEFSLLSKNFILICLSGFMYFGSFYLLLPTIPTFVNSLGGTIGQIGAVTGMFTLASVILRPYLGNLTNKYGRKKILLLGSGMFTLIFIPYIFVHSILPLYFIRIFHGIAHGAYLAAAYAYVADIAPAERRGEVMGVYGVANVFSMALFPALGTYIISETGNYQLLFILSIAVALCAFLSVAGLDEILPDRPHGKQPKLIEISKKPAVITASLTFFTASTLYGTVITFLPVYAPSKGIHQVGVFFSVYALFTLFSRVFAGKISDRHGRAKVIIPFMLILAISAFMLAILNGTWMLIIIGAFFGLGFGAFLPALNAYIVDKTEPSDRAGALAVFTAFMDIGITTGAIVFGFIGQFGGYPVMYILTGILVCCGVFLFSYSNKKVYK